MEIRSRSLLLVVAFVLVYLGSVVRCVGAEKVSIVVNHGSFSSVGAAALAEERVDWWDSDPADDRACTESFAAAELAWFLPLCMKVEPADVRFESPKRLPKTGLVFLVGSQASNAQIAKLDLPDRAKLETDESYLIKTIRKGRRTLVVIEGKDRVGILYGVYRYLEMAGIRFIGLGEQGMVLPESLSSSPGKLAFIENPSFLTRGFWAWEDRGDETFFLWMARNRLNFWTAAEKEVHLLKKLGIRLTDGGHILQKLHLDPEGEYAYDHPSFEGDARKPADPYSPGTSYQGDVDGNGRISNFEAHPEWYGLQEGKRSPGIRGDFGDNYCTSNPDATQEFLKNLVQGLVDGRWRYVDVLNFWMLDGGDWCTCEACEALGSYTDRQFILVHTLMNEIRAAQESAKLNRRVQVSVPAYHETLDPPAVPLPDGFDYENCSVTFFPIRRCSVHPFGDPDCTEFNLPMVERLTGWTTGDDRHYQGSMFIGEYYNISGYKSLPVVFTKLISTDVPWYFGKGARHFHYMHTPTRLWGTWTLNQYLLAKLLWDVDTDAAQLVDGYFLDFYPTAHAETRSFYQHLERATASIRTIKYGLRRSMRRSRGDIFRYDHMKYEVHKPEQNDGPDMVEVVASMQEARRALDSAILAVGDPVEQARLMEDERRFAYGEEMIGFFYELVRLAMHRREGNEDLARLAYSKVQRHAEALRQVTDLVQVSSSHANAENGLEATQMGRVLQYLETTYGSVGKVEEPKRSAE